MGDKQLSHPPLYVCPMWAKRRIYERTMRTSDGTYIHCERVRCGHTWASVHVVHAHEWTNKKNTHTPYSTYLRTHQFITHQTMIRNAGNVRQIWEYILNAAAAAVAAATVPHSLWLLFGARAIVSAVNGHESVLVVMWFVSACHESNNHHQYRQKYIMHKYQIWRTKFLPFCGVSDLVRFGSRIGGNWRLADCRGVVVWTNWKCCSSQRQLNSSELISASLYVSAGV